MRKKIILSAFSIALVLVACSPKTSKSTAATAPAKKTSPAEPTEFQLTAVKTKYPDATIDVLKKGYSIYYDGACIRCHGPKNIERRDEKEWVGVLDNMAGPSKA